MTARFSRLRSNLLATSGCALPMLFVISTPGGEFKIEYHLDHLTIQKEGGKEYLSYKFVVEPGVIWEALADVRDAGDDLDQLVEKTKAIVSQVQHRLAMGETVEEVVGGCLIRPSKAQR